jgi:nucleotide-binding universal stress UspA family protein
MKKIILAFDGVHFSEGAFEFARRLNELQSILLTGVFLPQAEIANLWSYADGVGVGAGPFIPLIESNESELVLQNIARFEKLCRGNGIDYRVHKDFYDFVIPELKKESRYADLLILGSEVFYENTGAALPNYYLRDALHDLACPVLLVPEKFDFPESIILAYDGSDESVYAIKQFAYLFPELTNKEVLLVYANDDAEEDFPDKIQVEELAVRHFTNLTLFKLDINPKKYFSTWVIEKKSALIVSGSYGRSGISQLFKKSFIKNVIADHRLPVFIAHK